MLHRLTWDRIFVICDVIGTVPFQVMEKVSCVSRLGWNQLMTYFAERLGRFPQNTFLHSIALLFHRISMQMH